MMCLIKWKRWCALWLALLLSILACPIKGAALSKEEAPTLTPQAPAPQTSATAMALYAPDADVFLTEKGADQALPMASTTKIMTAVVVLEHCDLSETVTVQKDAVGVEGTSVYLFEGEVLTVGTLLYALLLSSANDAAVALALHVAGSISAFADLMNEKARALGLENTHFKNPHGLHDEEHYTTARELAKITAHALKNPHFAEIVGTVRYTAPQSGTGATRLFLNHNKLLRTYDGAVGVKTGFTKASGRCLVSAACREGLLLIAVTLRDGNDWRDHTALLDWGFDHFTALTPKDAAYSLPVVGGTVGTVALLPREPFCLLLPKPHGEITVKTELPRFLFAPAEKGAEVGSIVYLLDGKEIGRVTLVTGEALVPLADRRTFLRKIKDFLKRHFGKDVVWSP